MEIVTKNDIALLSESIDLECKLATGRDGKGELPKKTFWESYSAFANTNGGTILLGVKEKKDHTFEVEGINDFQKVLDELWSSLENPQTISCNLLIESDVTLSTIDGSTVIQIDVPRASRSQKPVFRGGNPLTGTYQRYNTSDNKCSEETVKRLLADQVEDSRDDKLLENYDLNDLDLETLHKYRQMYATRDSANERNGFNDVEFLRSIGGWTKDRATGQEGLTVAGLLMFGKLLSIQDHFSNYMLDYQERPLAKTEERWIDRVSLDGSWSGNLFDFYLRVIKKITSDLKVPFLLKGDQRQDNTPLHDALREALVNSIVHADYTGKASVLIVKRPDMFGFRNPGLMRIPIAQAIQGYEHDCRNRKLHQMFHFIGLGERAGSGIPNIFRCWNQHHWKIPYLHEKLTPYDQTLLELKMIDLLPGEVVCKLQEFLGEEYQKLSNTDHLILATAFAEKTVSHSRLLAMCNEHSKDLTEILHTLVEKGYLNSHGYGQGTVYSLSNQDIISPDDVFGDTAIPPLTQYKGSGVKGLGLGVSSGGKDLNSGGKIVEGLQYPIYESCDNMAKGILKELNTIAIPIKVAPRVSKEKLTRVICNLCNSRYLTLSALAKILDRSEDYLRSDLLNPMVKNTTLIRAFPQIPNHPKQAYAHIPKIDDINKEIA